MSAAELFDKLTASPKYFKGDADGRAQAAVSVAGEDGVLDEAGIYSGEDLLRSIVAVADDLRPFLKPALVTLLDALLPVAPIIMIGLAPAAAAAAAPPIAGAAAHAAAVV